MPSVTARWVISEILAHRRVRRRQLGIVARTVSIPRSLGRELDLLSDTAVEVVELTQRGPAANAGIHTSDLIVAIQGRLVANADDIHRLLTQFPHDQSLVVTVVRDHSQLDLVIASG